MMDLKDKKGIEVELDKKRILRFDLNALIDIEDEFGTVWALFERLEKMNMKDIRFALYSGLKHEDKDLTLEKTGELVALQDLNYVLDKIGESLMQSLPDIDEDSEDEGSLEKN